MNRRMNPLRVVRDSDTPSPEEDVPYGQQIADPDDVEVVEGELVEDPDEGRIVRERLVDEVHLGPPVDDEGIVARLRGRRSEMQPVVQPWLRSRADVLAVLRLSGEITARRAGYQVARMPYYYLRFVGQSPRGTFRILRVLARWAADESSWRYLKQLEAEGDHDRAWILSEKRAARIKSRLTMLAGAASVLLLAGILLSTSAPSWAQWSALATVLGVLGAFGGRKDKPVFRRAVISHRVEPLTSDVVLRGLGATGMSVLVKAAESGNGVTFVSPITRDGPGYRADVDLPYGVTSTEVMEKRAKLAAGLRRQLGCVWPEGDPDQHPGRLVLWVGDKPLSQAKQPAWPLARKGSVDLFDATPFGTDQRMRWVQIRLMFASVVIGSIPRMGKTFLLRLLCLIAALDPRAELHLYDLKGTGDLSPLEPVAHRYRAGEEDDDIEYAVASMRELKQELRRRAKVIRELPKSVCPENKVTSELADKRSLRLHPIVIAVDECQVWFEHREYGDELEAICTDLVKRGPALGMIPLYATQRPDAKSLPTGISANAVIRLCLKVMGQMENDMVLGQSMHKNGIKATMFSRDDLGICYFAGEGDAPRIVRSVYVDAPAAERIARRARELREEAGTLSGYALGQEEPVAAASYNLLQDVAGVLAEERAWSETIIARLVDLRPDAYEGLTPTTFAARLKDAYGVETVQMELPLPDGGKANRRGVIRADVLDALAGGMPRS